VKIRDLHKVLSYTIGDGIDPYQDNGSWIIPDGARYIKDLRDEYLYRAAITVIERAVLQVLPISRADGSVMLRKLFPNFFEDIFIDIDLFDVETASRYTRYKKEQDVGMAYVASVTYEDDNESYPIVIMDGNRVSQLNNTKINHKPDPFTHVLGTPDNTDIEVYNTYDPFDLTTGKIRFIYLPYPGHPKDFTPDEEYPFEKLHIKTLINIAAIYARYDSQDSGDLDRFLQLEMAGMQSNANSNYQ